MDRIPITRKMIDDIFEAVEKSENPHQSDVLLRLYRIAFPDWDKIVKIDGHPKVHKETWLYICRRFQTFDLKYTGKGVMPAGIWLNTGFSGSSETGNPEVDLPEWTIDTSPCKVKYLE